MRSFSERATFAIFALALASLAVRGASAQPAPQPLVHHDLTVTLDPANHRLKVRDRIRIPGALVTAPLTLSLNAGLSLRTASDGLELVPIRSRTAGADSGIDRGQAFLRVPVNIYRVEGATPGQEFAGELDYEGTIDHAVQQPGAEYARAFSESPGLIEDRGVYLAASSHWVPQIGDALMTYTLAVELPAGWKSVSQGERTVSATSSAGARESWSVATATQEVHLIAARFTEYSRDAGRVKVMAFLRRPDPALADRYLDATGQYLQMYNVLLGPYPYSKFALVENFWETGYGMPSFTLLGEQVIRFPFILQSSYPHELLHNWWGNGVFVAYAGGNWCEGLTAYLADHLMAEQRGQGADHRRAILQRATDYVTPENDFPPSRFEGRHDAATEAIGYGKTAMFWNMLREKIGDAQFVKSLQTFYRDNRFRPASYDDIRTSFEETTHFDLRPFFDQWIKGIGAPELRLDEVAAHGARLDIALSQVQPGRPFALDIPVVIETDKGIETRKISMPSDRSRIEWSFDLSGTPQRVEIDPEFQLYRRLDPFEIPPSLSKAFGAKRVLIVLSGESAATYAGLVEAWTREGVEVVKDAELDSLPADKAVWVLGADNKFAPAIAQALAPYGASLDRSGFRTGGADYSASGRSVVAAVRNPRNPNLAMIYVSAPSEAAASALARKLPHYGKYSWLVFTGDEATNEATGEWPIGDTPLARNITAQAHPIKLTPRKALAEVKPAFDIPRMRADVEWLASPEREGRGAGSRGLEASADYIAERFERLGLAPLVPGAQGRDDYFQAFTMTGEDGHTVQARNVIAVLPGVNSQLRGEALLVSAHYDHLGFGWPDSHAGAKGQLHPGADDNASGVAVMLELARLMAKTRPDRTVIFAAFAGEEEGLVGSRHYVGAAQAPNAPFPLSRHFADLNLDTVGRLEDGKLAIFDSASAREWPFIFMGAGAVTGVPVTVVIQEIDASDDRSFVAAGVPAVQLFASVAADYHRPTDTADKIDYAGMAKVGAVLKEAADYLVMRTEPLSFSGSRATAQAGAPAAPNAPRRAATGIVPDMTDQGDGVRVGAVTPGSGADKAGIRPGDRLLALGGVRTSNLRALADALKDLSPGQTVDAEFAREAAVLHIPLQLGER